MSLEQPPVGRTGLRVLGVDAEPLVPAEQLATALERDPIEPLRPLLPVGYAAGVQAYQRAVEALTPQDLSAHYTEGLSRFHEVFVPRLKRRLAALSGGVFKLDDFVAYAAGSDVDLIGHIVQAAEGVTIFPGDWYGFLVGASRRAHIRFDANPEGRLAALCVPSVRNGHLTEEMVDFLSRAEACLLNINLFPTLASEERVQVARALQPLLERALLSISFSRGFGLTASQLGVLLIHKDHPLRAQHDEQWRWFTYFHNAIAASAFSAIDMRQLERVDEARRKWVQDWLTTRGLPWVESGSYYVRSFRAEGALPERLGPLVRGEVVRLCMKPPLV